MHGRRADHGRIVDAVNRKTHLLGGAVERRHREGVDFGLAGRQTFRRRIVDRVGVGAVDIEVERAEVTGRRRHRRLERRLAMIRIDDRDAAGRDQVAVGVDIGVFGDRCRRRIADRSRVVGTGDCDRHGRRVGAAFVVIKRDRRHNRRGLPGGKKVQRAIGDRVAPADRTVVGVAGLNQ